MTRLNLLLAAAASLTLAAAPISAQPVPPEPPIGTPRPFTMPAVERVHLRNGMTIAFVPFGSVPQTTLVVNSFAGDLNVPGRPWLSAGHADLSKRGAAGRDSSQLAEALSAMGGTLDAQGGVDATRYSTTVLSEHAGDAIGLLADVVRRPNMTQADFDRVTANLKRQLAQSYASPQAMADALLAKALYPGHPYGEPLPTAAQLDRLQLADLKRFHDQQLGAARTTLYVIGQFDRGAVLSAAEKAFGTWKAGLPRKMLSARATTGPRLILADRPGSQQTTVRLSFQAPAVGSISDIPFRVTDALLGGAFSSRITSNIREDKGYTYSPGSGVAGRPGGATWTWTGDITPAVTGKAMAEVFKEIRRLQSEPPSAAESLGMKTYTSTYLLVRTTSADLIANQLVRADLLGLRPSYFANYVQRALAVTPSEISAMAARTLPLERLTMVVVGDMKSVEPQLKALPELKRATVQHVALPKPAA